ncbi:hypothetical protein [Nesterenkonia rhizosphaerae]|uniref:Uncharacterized protein n=1 Tax=Nesterenkonia rhizosphaerae TaxID=1348272 RepID=A0ABP9G2N8_9MICC
MSDKAVTQDLMARLKRHYIKPGAPLPGGIFLPEVGMNGNWGSSNRCDAIYVGFTSSSGRILVGHEVKASRADWLKELEHRDKADAWADQCHEWWLVTAPDIVQDGELPAGWGHMVPGRSKTRMQILQKPARHTDRQPSWDVVRSIMARQDTLRADAISQAASEAEQEAQSTIDERVERALSYQDNNFELTRTRDELGRKTTLLREICEALGVDDVIPNDRQGRWSPHGDKVATPEALRALAPLVQGTMDATQVRNALVGRYRSVLGDINEAATRVTNALEYLQPAAEASE